jgi:hypothetical protein
MKQLLNLAYSFAIDVTPKKVLTKADECEVLGLKEGDVLPEEIIFTKQNLIKFINEIQNRQK